MKLMERYGEQVYGYEGACRGELEVDGDLLPFFGYYEAVQYSSGRFEVGVMVTGPNKSGSIPIGPNTSSLTFEGTSAEGWNIKPGGRVYFSHAGWAQEVLGFKRSGETLSAEYFETTLNRKANENFNKARFLISNLLWHGMNPNWLHPIELDVQGFHILINPVDDYKVAADNLVNGRGVEPTAWVNVEGSRGVHHPLETFRHFVDDLMFVFRLATGNNVDWYYGEGLDDSTGEVVERVHHNFQSSPYSRTILFSPSQKVPSFSSPRLDFDALVIAFFDQSNQILDKTSLKHLINQYTDAAGSTKYLESRGLLASTLTEVIASKYAKLRDKSEWIPEREYRRKVLPKLKETIRGLGLNETDEKQLSDNQIGGFRTSLKSKIRLLKKGLDIPLDEAQISRLVDTRNTLVHEGTFELDTDIEDWENEYNLMIFMTLTSICRLSGYQGDLPNFDTHWQICV